MAIAYHLHGLQNAAIKRLMMGRQAQISLPMPLDLLIRIDEQTARLSISRVAHSKQAVGRAVEGGLTVPAQAKSQRQATRHGLMERVTFSPTRRWRTVAAESLARIQGLS